MNGFERFDWAYEKYLPETGQGETMATQAVTAVAKLVYKWFNDGDVYDNTNIWRDGFNDLSSYANWLAKYTYAGETLEEIFDGLCDDGKYEDILYAVCEELLVEDVLAEMDEQPATGSIYDCEGPFACVDEEEDEEDYFTRKVFRNILKEAGKEAK